jgi:hypothetical protein
LQRIELKRQWLPKYRDYLQNCLVQPHSGHNESLVVLCIWCSDVEDWALFMPLAEYALTHNMNAPQGFKRTLAETLLEEVADQVLKAAEPHLMAGYVEHLISLTQSHDVKDLVRGKIYQAYGYALEATDLTHALTCYRQAHNYGASVMRKIKTILKRLEGVAHDNQ